MQQNDRVKAEKAILVGLSADCFRPEENATDESLDELEALLETAGGICEAKVLQNRHTPDPHSFIGEGKAQEVRTLLESTGATLVVFDNDLSPSQIRALEELTDATVLDRSALILDIFAQRAKTAEGRLQVELAQYQYLLPKLSGMGTSMSRLGGGIGTRGPGETRLEVDRRHIRRRIDELSRQLADLSRQREMRRARRGKMDQTTVALVGYTNAGKSTLLNALSGAEVLVEDKLFATLDPVVRQVSLPENRSCLMVDTVGFIRKLPHTLVEAFKSTLEEAVYADLLVIVSDLSSPFYRQQREVVYEVLRQLGADGKPVVEALNKADKAEIGGMIEPAGAILISAASGMGLDHLKAEISRRIASLRTRVTLSVPYAKGAVLNLLHDQGQVETEEYTETGTNVTCLLDATLYARVKKMLES